MGQSLSQKCGIRIYFGLFRTISHFKSIMHNKFRLKTLVFYTPLPKVFTPGDGGGPLFSSLSLYAGSKVLPSKWVPRSPR